MVGVKFGRSIVPPARRCATLRWNSCCAIYKMDWLHWCIIIIGVIACIRGQSVQQMEKPPWRNTSDRVTNPNINISEKEIIDEILGEGSNYDNRLRPKGGNGSQASAVNVTVNIYLRTISKIDDVSMEYSCQISFREQWQDNRLTYNDSYFKYVNLPDPERIWRPDLFFSNEKQGHFHDIVMPNVLLRLYPDGRILYSVRISLVLSCPMKLHYYPLDNQFCVLEMASYGYTTDDIVFIWKADNPVQRKPIVELPSFELKDISTSYCSSTTNTGQYSCLRVTLKLKRQFSYYLLQLYIPSYMLVIVSWVSFWLDKEAVPARVSLGVTTLLTMATQASGINSKLPPVSYTKAIDVWIGVSLTFIFGALLEFALVNYAARRDSKEQLKKDRERQEQLTLDLMEDGCGTQMKPLFNNSDTTPFRKRSWKGYETHDIHIEPRRKRKRGCYTSFLSHYKDRAKRIDVVARILFPAGFALFNVAYWLGYMLPEKVVDMA
ncbi:PREDICTED: glutamate-gated chloride channel-like isoform X2 [Priapulus caudatus]|uniref:Glutamate-gated chloride channel-like isoform X2 n=1 Tax=Priapulus caudatus TaxID=37621 RepID=A0ABM1E313_PRICU|nr:PREDICTED: glutamate-gated chloride channel-like isoform X2 [Priapulus caudatus]